MPTAIVTGSSRGIGRAIAHRFAADGFDVTVNYVEREKEARDAVEAVEKETESDAISVRADVSNAGEASDLVNRTVEAFGGIDHVVNNAGIDQHVYTENLSPGDFDRVMNVNVNGAFHVTKFSLPSLLQSTLEPSVTNVSSILAYTGAAIECHYASSKAGLIGLTKSHARDFAPDVRVNAVAPGDVQTDMTADRTPEQDREQLKAIPLERFGQPEDIAEAVAYLRDATFVTGETLNVNGGELMR